MAIELPSLLVKLLGDISDYEQKIDAAERLTANAGKSLSSAGKKMTTGVTLPLLGAGAAAVTFATQLNSGLANVASLGEEASNAVAGWKPELQAMAIEVGKSTEDMSQGLYNVVSAFGVADDTMQVLEINARAAAAGLSTTADAINLTSAVTKAYGDTSAEAVQHSADLALKTVQLGQTTFPELASAIGKVTPLASSLGISMEDMFGVMATATGVTGSAAEVSTQFAGIMRALMTPTEGMIDLWKTYGFESGEAMLQSMGLQGSIQAIVKYAENTGAPLSAYISSLTGQTLALALVNGQSDAWVEKTEAMYNASGALEEAFNAQTQGINASGFAMQQQKIKMQVMAQQIGDGLAPAVGALTDRLFPLVNAVSSLATRFSELDPNTQLFIVGIVGAVAAIGPLLMMLGFMMSGVSSLIGLWGAVSTAFTAFSAAVGIGAAPIIAIIALIAAAAYGLYYAWTNNLGGIQQKVQAVITWMQGFIQAGLQYIQGWWQAHGDSIVTIVQWYIERVRTGLNERIEAIKAFIQSFLNGVQAFWAAHGEVITSTAQAIWNIVREGIQAALDAIGFIIDAFAAATQGDWYAFGENIRKAWDRLWNAMVNIVARRRELVQEKIRYMTDYIKNWFNNIDWAELGRRIIDGIVNGITNGVGALKAAAEDAANAALEAAKGFLGIKSPSRVAALQIGVPFAEGVAMGIMDASPIDRALQSVTAKLGEFSPNSKGGAVQQGDTRGRPSGGTIIIEKLIVQANDPASLLASLQELAL